MTIPTPDYVLRVHRSGSIDANRPRVAELLKEEGFGILTEIDVAATLREKLGVDVEPYLILGACNPPLAYKALQAEPEIGLLLPCNVIVYETEQGHSVVSAVDPDSMLAVVGENAPIAEVAREAKQRLVKALESLS